MSDLGGWRTLKETVDRMNEFQKALDAEMQQAYKDRIADQVRGGEVIRAMNKAYQDQWAALPRRTKLYRRTKGWIYWKRRSLGELIAGEKFNDC